MQPGRPYPSPNDLSGQMQGMHLQQPGPPPPQPQNGGQQSPPPALGPAKTKRAPRAYHAPEQAHQQYAQPDPYQQQQQHPDANGGYQGNPQAQYQQQQHGSYQGQHPHQQYQQQQQHQEQPVHRDLRSHPDRPADHYEQQQAAYLAQQRAQAEQAALQASQGPSHIPQPPHASGQRLPGPRTKIDPNQIPSPVAVAEAEQSVYRDREEGGEGAEFWTNSRAQVPGSATEVTVVDQGNSSPRFMRLTTYTIPTTADLSALSCIPLGLLITPFARPAPSEPLVPRVDFSDKEGGGPPRCARCRAYVAPGCAWRDGGTKWSCALCGNESETPAEYFSHLDMSGRRMDLTERPELAFGSVDFVVGKDYWAQEDLTAPGAAPREPKPLNYIFAIDVSWSASRCGLVKEVAETLKEMLYGGGPVPEGVAGQGWTPGARIGICTFDRTVQFFNLSKGLESPQMMVVGDLMDMFVPIGEGFLVDPLESRELVEQLLDNLPSYSADNQVVEAALGAAVKAGHEALKHLGGVVSIFQTSLPTLDPGALKHREDTKLYGTEKEKTLFSSQDPWYRQTAEECSEAGIGINLFLFPNQYVDVASLGVLTGITGGEIFFHPRFEPVRDGRKLRDEVRRVVLRETGTSVTLRVRCSNGLRISDHYGNFFQRNVTDLEFGAIDADKCIAAHIKHEAKLDEKQDAYFQCAVLYTSKEGERRVRVHNIGVPVAATMGNVFRFADMDGTLAFEAKRAMTMATSKMLRDVREILTETCVKVLYAYRKHCASSTSPGQLILPESFKLFPVYALGLMKTKALKGGPVASDVRMWSNRMLRAAPVVDIINLIYPRMLPVHTLEPDMVFPVGWDGQSSEGVRIRMPPLMRPSYARMEGQGAYLIENGLFAILWLGQGVSPQILQDLYGVENLDELDTRITTLPALPTRLSKQLRAIISHLEAQRGGRHLPVLIARQNTDGTEVEFSNMLVEDANNDLLGYVDYLCLVHQRITSGSEGDKQKSDDVDASIWRSWQ